MVSFNVNISVIIESMHRLAITKHGKSIDSLRVIQEDLPVLAKDKIRIKVIAASVNPADYKMIHGLYKRVQRLQFPAPIGYDCSGVIIAVGEDVLPFKPGDRVIACLEAKSPGSIAEFVDTKADYLTLASEHMDLSDQAALPLAGMTVLQCFDQGQVKSGDRILIQAGSGGVGHLAIQMAKTMGVEVYATTSSKNEEWVKQLGADHVICYDRESYEDYRQQFDMVLDSLGEEHSQKVLKCLKPGGYLVNITGGLDKATAKRLGVPWIFQQFVHWQLLPLLKACKKHGVNYRYVLMQSNRSDLDRLVRLVDDGLKVTIEKRFSLADSQNALVKLEGRRVKGKLLILTDN